MRSDDAVSQRYTRPTARDKQKDKDKARAKAKATAKDKTVDFSNYYDVLELPEDYFSPDKDYAETRAEPAAVKKSATERQRMFDEAFENELHAELSFLLMELDELLEAVHNAFLYVKREKRTLVEATAVTKVAVDCAATVFARLEVRYPSIRSGYSMMTVLRDRIPADEYEVLWDKVLSGWSPDVSGGQPKAEPAYVAGSIIVDLVWVANVLEPFVATIPPPRLAHAKMGVMDDGHYGSPYNEETTPQYVWPSMHPAPPFFGRQLPILYNMLAMEHRTGATPDTESLEGWFLDYFRQVVTKRTATLPCVFLFVCWVRSVAVLQGDGGLTRTVELSILRRLDIEDRLRASLTNHAVATTAPDLHKLMTKTLKGLEQSNENTLAVRSNPLLAGCVLLDHVFVYHQRGDLAALSMPRFRGFAHIYNAMVDRQLMEPLPLMEGVIRAYERSLFTPSRAAVKQGSFMRSFFLSSHMTNAGIDAGIDSLPRPPKRSQLVGMNDFEFSTVSLLYRVLKNKDFSELSVTSWKSLLTAVSDQCSEELYESRVLSRDILKLIDEISDTFVSLTVALNRHEDIPAIAAEQEGLSRKPRLNLTLEHAVMNPLLPFLDCIDDDGSFVPAKDSARFLRATEESLLFVNGDEVIRGYTARAAAAVSKHFAHRTPEEVNATFFIFPSTPCWASIEFGTKSYKRKKTAGISEKTFAELIPMLENSHGPLQGDGLKRLKEAVAEDPGVFTCGWIDTPKELSTILHHAVAGAIRDRRLVEWLIGAGALAHEIVLCRIPTAKEQMRAGHFDVDRLSNLMAVHSAAKAGFVDMVRVLLEAGHMRDLNTLTFHTRETLLHLAVKHGHRDVFNYLADCYAEMRTKDGAGDALHSLTSDKSWKRDILELTIEQQRQADLKPNVVKKRVPQVARDSAASAEQVRKALAKQREAERAAIGGSVARKA